MSPCASSWLLGVFYDLFEGHWGHYDGLSDHVEGPQDCLECSGTFVRTQKAVLMVFVTIVLEGVHVNFKGTDKYNEC